MNRAGRRLRGPRARRAAREGPPAGSSKLKPAGRLERRPRIPRPSYSAWLRSRYGRVRSLLTEEAENHLGPLSESPRLRDAPLVSARPHPGHVCPHPTPKAAPRMGSPRQRRKTPPSQRQLDCAPTPSSRSSRSPPGPRWPLRDPSWHTGSVHAARHTGVYSWSFITWRRTLKRSFSVPRPGDLELTLRIGLNSPKSPPPRAQRPLPGSALAWALFVPPPGARTPREPSSSGPSRTPGVPSRPSRLCPRI